MTRSLLDEGWKQRNIIILKTIIIVIIIINDLKLSTKRFYYEAPKQQNLGNELLLVHGGFETLGKHLYHLLEKSVRLCNLN